MTTEPKRRPAPLIDKALRPGYVPPIANLPGSRLIAAKQRTHTAAADVPRADQDSTGKLHG